MGEKYDYLMFDHKILRHARLQREAHPDVKKKEKEFSDEEITQKYHEAGKVAAQIRDKIAAMVKPGVKVYELCLKADELIKEAGQHPSFPINISINNVAAHYTAPIGSELKIKKGDIVKVDLGTHVDGFISDTAVTVDLSGKNQDLLKATIEATNTAIDLIRPGTNSQKLGALIEDVIRGYDFNPVVDLSGHLVKRWVVHGDKSIPIVGNKGGDDIEANEVYAIETFASTGSGSIHFDVNQVTIFRVVPYRVPLRSRPARKILSIGIKEFKGLPFAERWLLNYLQPHEVRIGMRELRKVGGVVEYHILIDRDPTALISQHEHTLIVREDGAEVTTKL